LEPLSLLGGSRFAQDVPFVSPGLTVDAVAVEGGDNPVAGSVNYMSETDFFFQNASKRLDIDPNGFFDVIARGNANVVEIMTANGPWLVDQRVLANLIRSNPSHQFGQPIRLLSCSTGSCDTGMAQNLANKMRAPVQVPTDIL
jgi:filamentous hemagglutinin